MSIAKPAHPFPNSTLKIQAYLKKNYCFDISGGAFASPSLETCAPQTCTICPEWLYSSKMRNRGVLEPTGICWCLQGRSSLMYTPKYAQRGEWGPFGESVKNLNVMKNWISSFWSIEVHALCIKLYLFKLDLMWFTVQWPNRLLISSIELSHGVIFPLDWTFKDFIIYSPPCCPACKKEATILIYKNIYFYYSSVCIKSIFWVWSKNSFTSSFHFSKASFIYVKSDCWGRHW